MQSTADAKKLYLRTLIWVSAIMVLATFLLRWGFAPMRVIAPLNLTNENVVAAWYSGMLLMLGSLHAADGYFRLRHTDLKAALAWCVISGMLLALSADEIGSLHERADDVLHMGTWLSFLPLFIVLVGGCTLAFMTLWRTPSDRRNVPWLLLGFVILASVGGQEYLEKTLNWPWYLKPFRSAFEEGSELVGMMILIRYSMHNSEALFEPTPAPQGSAFSSVVALRWIIAIASALIVWPVADMTSQLDDQYSVGHPSDWLSCALFALAAAALLHRWVQSGKAGAAPVSAIAWLGAASAICVQVNPIGPSEDFPLGIALHLGNIEINARLLLLALCSLGVAEAFRARGAAYRTGAVLFVVSAVISALLSVYDAADSLRWGYFASGVVGIAIFTIATNVARQPVSVGRAAPARA